MIYYVDIDGTICSNTNGKYADAAPIYDRIEAINSLYDDGNTIVYWTARGSVTGIDWTELTTNQLKQWNVKYHDVKLGKPHYDLFICDKAIESETFFNEKIKN
tara:strand:+ start:7318 stop:7626 length:309 start_codon:yes stop_codon:yes gene_type:complete